MYIIPILTSKKEYSQEQRRQGLHRNCILAKLMITQLYMGYALNKQKKSGYKMGEQSEEIGIVVSIVGCRCYGPL